MIHRYLYDAYSLVFVDCASVHRSSSVAENRVSISESVAQYLNAAQGSLLLLRVLQTGRRSVHVIDRVVPGVDQKLLLHADVMFNLGIFMLNLGIFDFPFCCYRVL